MPRNASGTYTLPEVSFVAGTVIQSSAVNSDLSDIATALTQSLATTGVSTMSGPIKAAAGTTLAPSYTFGTALGTGFYLSGTNEISWTANGTQRGVFAASGLVTFQDLLLSSTITLTNTGLHILDTNTTHDLIIKPGSDLSADRTLSIVTGDQDVSFTLQGDTTLPVGAVIIPTPGGYLTPTAGIPIIISDATSATSVIYEPFISNRVPLVTSSIIGIRGFTALTLTLNNPNHVANTIYDVFLDWDGAAVRIGTGPAWSNSGAGTGTRGAGAGTTELTRSSLLGMFVNANSMTARNGGSTYTIAVGEGLYIGSIFIDAAAGQVTCHRSFGQSRKWGVWNTFNKQPTYLKAGDSTASWNYNTNTVRASNGSSANSLTIFSGLQEDNYELRFVQRASLNSDNAAQIQNGIGVNSTTVFTGRVGNLAHTSDASGGAMIVSTNLYAEFFQPPLLGINVITALENAPIPADTTPDWFGGSDDMVLSAQWRV